MFKKEGEQLEKYRFTTYLIGAMEKPAEGDDGQKKRAGLEEELLKRKVYPINPVKLERYKIGMDTKAAKEIMAKWIKEGNWSEYAKMSRLIWKGKDIWDDKNGLIHIPGDLDYVAMSDWITFILNKGDQPCGAYGETFVAFDKNKPVHLITDVPMDKLKHSLIQAIIGSGGYVFDTENAYLHFIDNQYQLRREDK